MTQSVPPQPQAVNQAIQADTAAVDRMNQTKTLYDTSTGSIFWKNFVAGFARALGGMIIWLILIIFSGYVMANYVWPQIRPFLTSYQQLLESFTAIQSAPPGTTPNSDQVQNILDQPEVQNLLNRLEQSPGQ